MNRKRLLISTSVAFVAVFAVAAVMYRGAGEDAKQAQSRRALLERPHAPVKGSRSAKVNIVEFLDPACGTCRDFHPIVRQMVEDNPGRIRVTVRYAPFHPNSDYVVKVIEAARMQGKWQQALEALFASQASWSPNHAPRPDLVWSYLGGLGLDLERVRTDMKSPEIAQHLAQDLADAKALNVTQTPEFFVNGRAMPSFGRAQLEALVRDALKESYP